MSWQPLTPERGFCSVNLPFFTCQQRFFVPVISRNIFSSLFESGNTSAYFNCCLPTSNVTSFCYLSGSHLLSFRVTFVSFPHLPLFCLGRLSSLVALLVFGVRLGFRSGLLTPNVTHACMGFLVCSKTKGSFLWDTRDVEENTEIKGGFIKPGLSCLWPTLCRRETKKAVQKIWFRLW